MERDLLAKFAFVLVRPQHAGNVGAAARALKNMGIGDLRTVGALATGASAAEASRMAVHACDLLESARNYDSLHRAIADCTVTVGTTCRTGLYRSGVQRLREAALDLVGMACANRIAILFGSEDHGLTNEELASCQRLIVIPSAPDYPSLNLAQAVMVVAYELMMGARGVQFSPSQLAYAPVGEVEAMLTRMARALVDIGFLPADNPEHIMFGLRAIFGRSGLTPRELAILNGIANQIRWFADGGYDVAERKHRAGERLR